MSTIAKALALLDLFSEARPRLGLSDVQRLTGRDKATVHRHLSALADAGFLEQNPTNRTYQLGHALSRLAATRNQTVPAAERVSHVVDDISRQAGELVHLSRLRNFDLIDLYHAEKHAHPVRVSFDATGLPPLFTTSSGRAILAYASKAFVAAALEDHHARRDTPLDAAEVMAELDAVRAQGFASTRDLLAVGISSVAVPVFDAAGHPSGACSIAYPTARGSLETPQRFAHLLASQGPRLTTRLGGQVPDTVQTLWARIAETPIPPERAIA